jgi:hypothetical protein
MQQLDLTWYRSRFACLERLFWAALAGGVLVPGGILLNGVFGTFVTLIGVLLIVPLLGYLAILPVLHWKDGYRGNHSNLWGALLVLEASGWFKLIYWFRHLLPGYRRARRAASFSAAA